VLIVKVAVTVLEPVIDMDPAVVSPENPVKVQPSVARGVKETEVP
jgi:hypothetical protein